MSRQLKIPQKKKMNQLTLSFFANKGAPKFASVPSNGRQRCIYCDEWFSSQGYSSHIKTHQLDPNVRPKKKAKYGKVKHLDIEKRNEILPSADVDDDVHVQHKESLGDTGDVGSGGADDDVDSAPDGGETGSVVDDNSIYDASSSVSDNNVIGGNEFGPDTRKNNDDDGVVTVNEPNGNGNRASSFKPHQIVEILDEWHRRKNKSANDKSNNPPSINSILRWIRTEYNRPKFQRNQFNRWLKEETRIRQSGIACK